MKKRDTLPKRSVEEINNEYAQLCMKLGDALMREQMAKREAQEIWPKLYKLNDEAIEAKKRSPTSGSGTP